jgi:hypothetical protein
MPLALVGAITTAAVLAPPADAVPIVVTDGSTLVSADTNNLPTPPAPVPVTGMQPGEVLVGIDQRPATGQLYGIGSSGRVYVLDPVSGAATQVGAAGPFSLNGTAFGTDINPVPDRIRLVSNNEQNLRLNPNDGSLTATDALLTPAGNVVAAAYTNNVAGATSTTLFDIDSADGKLYMQGGAGGTPSPNGGALNLVGSLGLAPTPLNENIGFDIGADAVAFATITTGGVSKLYGINTTTGAATNLGTIGTGATPYSGLAIMPARIHLTSSTVNASEGSTATFEVTRNAPAAGPVTVDYSTAAGTATSGDDFGSASGTLSWTAGESGTKTIAVPIPADSAAEGDETFSVSLSHVTGADAVLGAPATATATIAANEAGPTLQFGAPSAAAAEGGSATLEVTRAGSATQPVSVGYATAAGSANENDYTPATGTVSWAAGDSAPKTISIPIADDQAEEGEEGFGVSLQNPAGGATLGSPAAATVTIAASDPAAPPLAPVLKLGGTKKQKLSTVKRKGVSISATTDSACRLTATVKRGKRTIGSKKQSLVKGKKSVKIKIKSKERKRLRAKQKLTVSATCTSAAGKSASVKRTVTLKR